MGKTRAEIQAAYRERKKQKIGEEAFLMAERNRVKKYYTPVDQLPKRKRAERRREVAQRVRKHRLAQKKITESRYYIVGYHQILCIGL